MNSVFKNWQIFPKYSMYLNKKQILYKRRLFNALLKKLKKQNYEIQREQRKRNVCSFMQTIYYLVIKLVPIFV